jgi:hypothetical protein
MAAAWIVAAIVIVLVAGAIAAAVVLIGRAKGMGKGSSTPSYRQRLLDVHKDIEGFLSGVTWPYSLEPNELSAILATPDDDAIVAAGYAVLGEPGAKLLTASELKDLTTLWFPSPHVAVALTRAAALSPTSMALVAAAYDSHLRDL